MIAHLVLFTPKASLTPDAQVALLDALSSALREIESIRRVRVGKRRTHGWAYEQLMQVNYSHAAVLEFDDIDGLRAYLQHPAHANLATQFFSTFERALMYDFELIEGEAALQQLLDD